jgi:glucosamine-6-phosphate deaminase
MIVERLTPAGWAGRVASLLVDAVRREPRLRICLPTGMTPMPVYERLVAAVERREISLSGVEIFLLDEFGGVSPADPGRCDQMLRRSLLDHVDVAEERFHRFELTGDVDAECERYEELVGPGCDLTLLGIGTNGHVGMNEPGSAPDSLTRRVTLSPETIAASARYFGRDHDLPTWGVTAGIATLLRSREIWLLATGAGKASIVSRLVEGPVTPAVPASLLRDHPNIRLLADEDALAHVAHF